MSDVNLLAVAITFGVLLVSLTIHEAAHAWTADRLGDSTARLLGRVSLNPIVHIDPIGTVLLPLIAALSSFPIIGWAKPVPVNIMNLRHPRRDFVLVAAAGPISNLLQAFVAAVVLRILLATTPPIDGSASLPANVLFLGVRINLLLAFFNLIPVPPLDGGSVLLGLLPPSAARSVAQFRQFGFIVLYLLMFTGLLSAIIAPPTNLLLRLLLP